MSRYNRKSTYGSAARASELDEEHVRKVVADNPDILHCRLARRFGISTHRLRVIAGLVGAPAELLQDEIKNSPYVRSSGSFWERNRKDSRRLPRKPAAGPLEKASK